MSTKIRIALIAALAPNMAIGEGDRLPWKMPRDMKFFRLTTRNHVVIMGRKTFESLGEKPLPKRTNIILSRTRQFDGKNVFTAHSLEEAIDVARLHTKKSRIFVIGGGSIYEQTIKFADELYLTFIEEANSNLPLFAQEFEADTFFPKFHEKLWKICHVSRSYKALSSLAPASDIIPKYYFRFWKLVKPNCGCTQVENKRMQMKSQHSQLEFPFWKKISSGN